MIRLNKFTLSNNIQMKTKLITSLWYLVQSISNFVSELFNLTVAHDTQQTPLPILTKFRQLLVSFLVFFLYQKFHSSSKLVRIFCSVTSSQPKAKQIWRRYNAASGLFRAKNFTEFDFLSFRKGSLRFLVTCFRTKSRFLFWKRQNYG